MRRIARAAICVVSFTTALSSSAVDTSSAPSPIKLASNVTANGNTSSVPASSLIHLRCDGDLYKRDLRKGSCINARRGMVEDMEWFSIGPQGGPMLTDVNLPYRWISGMR